jgi:hypothetical protein
VGTAEKPGQKPWELDGIEGRLSARTKIPSFGPSRSSAQLVDCNRVVLREYISIKVCNQPDLFECADVTAPFAICDFAQSGSLSREKDVLFYPDTAKNPPCRYPDYSTRMVRFPGYRENISLATILGAKLFDEYMAQ